MASSNSVQREKISVVLYCPKMPGNVGNIIRLCGNLIADLHIIKPIPFKWDDKKLRRAGLDYHEFCDVHFHESFSDFLASYPQARVFLLTTKSSKPYYQAEFKAGDFLLFGSEDAGCPPEVHEQVSDRFRIPMQAESRSLNLSNAVAVILCEAYRQNNYFEFS